MTRPRVAAWLACALPALVAWLVYRPALGGGFVGDDYSMLWTAHAAREAGDALGHALAGFLHPVTAASNQYRPLTLASFALSEAGSGADAAAWRAANVALHAANAALVALLVIVVTPAVRGAAGAAVVAGVLFACFPTSVEAVAWIAGRFDLLATFWMLVAAITFAVGSGRFDGWRAASLGATLLALASKESAVLAIVLVVALAARRAWDDGAQRGLDVAARTWRAAWPWVLLALGYFVWRQWLFGDPFRVFAGSNPGGALGDGTALRNAASLAAWWPAALPMPVLRHALAAALVAMLVLALALARERGTVATASVALLLVVAASGVLVAMQLRWPANGQGGRNLYAVVAAGAVLAALPLMASQRWLRRATLAAAIVALVAAWPLLRDGIAQRAAVQQAMGTLATSLARIAAETPPGEYVLVVIPDQLGAVPFGRGSQGGLVMPPVQATPLSPRLLVQTTYDLPAWPELLARDFVGRLMREPLASVAAQPMGPRVAPPYRMPDRYWCFDAQRAALVPLALAWDGNAQTWIPAWKRALAAAGCAW
ncbi:MAG: hypothetical protein JSR18_15270 [Proteobacteria bacterium]|nr:hypothetical protein [Pseudomonadota bacterium]